MRAIQTCSSTAQMGHFQDHMTKYWICIGGQECRRDEANILYTAKVERAQAPGLEIVGARSMSRIIYLWYDHDNHQPQNTAWSILRERRFSRCRDGARVKVILIQRALQSLSWSPRTLAFESMPRRLQRLEPGIDSFVRSVMKRKKIFVSLQERLEDLFQLRSAGFFCHLRTELVSWKTLLPAHTLYFSIRHAERHLKSLPRQIITYEEPDVHRGWPWQCRTSVTRCIKC